MHSGLIQQLSNLTLPEDTVIKAVFYFISGLIVLFSIRMVTSRNIFHSAIFLAMTLIGITGIYLYLDAEFLAIAQIMIYVGAVVTLFIFVIMLTANIQDRAIRQVNEQALISAAGSLIFLFLFIKIIRANRWQPAGQVGERLSIEHLGTLLMTTYLLPFEVISLILIAVLVGAIVIAKADKR